MDAKNVYWQARAHFLSRNSEVLPQAQLQTGRNERWFVREFAMAMNYHFCGRWAPSTLSPYADCECS